MRKNEEELPVSVLYGGSLRKKDEVQVPLSVLYGGSEEMGAGKRRPGV